MDKRRDTMDRKKRINHHFGRLIASKITAILPKRKKADNILLCPDIQYTFS